MTSHRDSTDTQFQAAIDGLSHTSIPTKLAVIESLDADLLAESTALETQRNQLHKHKQKIAGLVSDLQSISSGVEYTVDEGGGGGSTDPLPPAKVVYVSVTYNGGGDDGSREKPYTSLAAAIVAKCGVSDGVDRIFDIASGIYTVTQTITKDVNVRQNVTFRGRGPSSTFIQAGTSFEVGKASDCFKLTNFGSLKFEDLTIRHCKYGIRVSCDDFTLRRCAFHQCGCDDTSSNFDFSLTQSQQVTVYAAATDGGALRVDSADGFVRVEDNYVDSCNRGLRIGDSVKGGSVKRNHVQKTLQAGIYLSASSYTGSSGCHNFHVSDNQVINACNNSILIIGGRNNTVSSNVAKGGWNSAIMGWHCAEFTVSDNLIEKTNFSIFNGQGVLSDSWGAGIVLDGDDNIFASATYQVRITGNVITQPSIGRAAAIYAIRILNDEFDDGNVVFCQDNVSSGAAVHVKVDQPYINLVDMDTRLQSVFSASEKNAIQASVTALEGKHPITPSVYENLTNGDNVQILNTDTIALIKHDQVENLTVIMPADAQTGQIIAVKNYHIGNASQGGNYVITLVPAPGQSPTHVIDYKYSSLELKASTVASGLLSDVNETVRLMWYGLDATWISLNDAF